MELLIPTHRGLHKFIPRHSDEIGNEPFLDNVPPLSTEIVSLNLPTEVDIGDPIYVEKEDEDLWCEGNKIRWLLLIGHYLPPGKKKQVSYDTITPTILKGK